MIILKRNKFLFHNGAKYSCLIGKNGIRRLKKEGDWCTPTGKFTLGPVYYRKDKINRLETRLKCFTIKKNMCWKIIRIAKTIIVCQFLIASLMRCFIEKIIYTI